MIFYTNIEKYSYDYENLLKIFTTKDKIKITAVPFETADFYVSLTMSKEIRLFATKSNSILCNKTFPITGDIKNQTKGILYDFLSEFHGKTSPWGILVGIRPVKIVHEALDHGKSIDGIKQMLLDIYRVSEEKVELAINIALRERPYLYPIEEKALSLYICIPFCPTRCLYCSFPSNSTENKKKWIRPYVEALIKEIHETGTFINQSDYFVDCIYFGGGTPTSLDVDDLRDLFTALEMFFDLSNLKEFTFEAGRPDTITEAKLTLLKEKHVDRICLNPQTFNDDTLVKIGRQHTVDDIYKVYDMIKTFNFKSINMDIILGLIDEKKNHLENTIEGLRRLNPENVTVHTLSVKRSSRLNQFKSNYTLDENPIEDYMNAVNEALKKMGYNPYYMYRQKNILANLENTGFAKDGFESLYNMRIMEEKHTILALGAGAVSKFVNPTINQFNRCANSKGLEDYIKRIDEMIEKKIVYLEKLSNQD